MNRLTASKVKPFREKMHLDQQGRCALTHYPLSPDKAVLDHCHTSGHVRGVLDRGVNALLGKIENNYKRYGLSLPQVFALGRGLEAYLTREHSANPLYPTHKTEDEKRIRRNTKARARRAATKES